MTNRKNGYGRPIADFEQGDIASPAKADDQLAQVTVLRASFLMKIVRAWQEEGEGHWAKASL